MGKTVQQNKRQTRSQKNGKTWKPVSQMIPFIQLKTKIWSKDSHGLFDYEAAQQQYVNQNQKIVPFKKKILKGQKRSRQTQKDVHIMVYRTKDCKTILVYNNQPKPTNEHINVCEIIASKTKKKYTFKVKTSLKLENLSSALERQASKLQNKVEFENFCKDKPLLNFKNHDKEPQIKVFNPMICPFTVTKKFFKGNSNVQGYPLKPGNIIKFGRVQYVVTELKTAKQFISLRSTTDLKDISGYESIFEVPQQQNGQGNESKSQGYVPTCKICLCHEETQENILISPCKCKGYCGVIHIDCLKQWINSKVRKDHHRELVISYNFNKFECEICKVPFPQIIKMADKRIEMMCIEKPNKPYIMIESINPPRSLMSNLHQRQEDRCLHVISTNDKVPLKIGRGHMCDIRISDISVSRSHAEIEFNDGKFLIRDTNSKFGTLVLFDEEFDINNKHSFMLQSGRCLYEFSIEKEQIEQENEGATESENEEQGQNQQNQVDHMNAQMNGQQNGQANEERQ